MEAAFWINAIWMVSAMFLLDWAFFQDNFVEVWLLKGIIGLGIFIWWKFADYVDATFADE